MSDICHKDWKLLSKQCCVIELWWEERIEYDTFFCSRVQLQRTLVISLLSTFHKEMIKTKGFGKILIILKNKEGKVGVEGWEGESLKWHLFSLPSFFTYCLKILKQILGPGSAYICCVFWPVNTCSPCISLVKFFLVRC